MTVLGPKYYRGCSLSWRRRRLTRPEGFSTQWRSLATGKARRGRCTLSRFLRHDFRASSSSSFHSSSRRSAKGVLWCLRWHPAWSGSRTGSQALRALILAPALVAGDRAPVLVKRAGRQRPHLTGVAPLPPVSRAHDLNLVASDQSARIERSDMRATGVRGFLDETTGHCPGARTQLLLCPRQPRAPVPSPGRLAGGTLADVVGVPGGRSHRSWGKPGRW